MSDALLADRPSQAQANWNDGYYVQSAYANHPYRALCPHHLSAALMMNGVQAPRTDQPFTYMELGCGNGISTAFFAAANPHGTFIANDFMPEHISYATRLVREAHLENVTFLESSFEQLLEQDIPPCDFIVMHGVYSWVSDEQRSHLHAIIDRCLKPGGVLYVSYNAKPGHGFLSDPVRQFLLEYCRTHGGQSESNMRKGIKALQELAEADSALSRSFPGFADKVSNLAHKDIRYLMHEYMNGHHKAFYCTEVMEAMDSHQLEYGAAAKLIQNRKNFLLSPQSHAFQNTAADNRSAELYSDYLRNNSFRSDIYHRGADTFTAASLRTFLEHQRFMLARPRAACRMQASIPGGSMGLDERIYRPILDRLHTSPSTLNQLQTDHPDLLDKSFGEMLQYLITLLAVDYIQYALPEAGSAARYASCKEFNDIMHARTMNGEQVGMLASPISGNANACDTVSQLMLHAYTHQEAEPLAYVESHGKALGLPMQSANPQQPLQQAMQQHWSNFRQHDLPYLRQLGIVMDHG